MPIREVAAPERETAKVLIALKSMIAARQVGTPLLSKADPASLSIVLSTPLAFLPLGPIEKDFDLRRSAKLEGWRFYVSADGTTSIASVRTTSIDFQIKEICEGPAVTAVTSALDTAMRHDLVQAPTLWLWQLVVPALYVMPLWLRAEPGDKDLLVPIQPTVPDFVVDVAPEARFTEDLIKLAEAAKNESWSAEGKGPTAH